MKPTAVTQRGAKPILRATPKSFPPAPGSVPVSARRWFPVLATLAGCMLSSCATVDMAGAHQTTTRVAKWGRDAKEMTDGKEMKPLAQAGRQATRTGGEGKEGKEMEAGAEGPRDAASKPSGFFSKVLHLLNVVSGKSDGGPGGRNGRSHGDESY